MVAQMQSNRLDSKKAYSDGATVDRNASALSNQDGSNSGFSNMLVQVVNGQTGTAQGNVNASVNLGTMIPGLLLTLMNPTAEGSSDEKTLNDLLNLLQTEDPSTLQTLLQNPQFVDWMNQVAVVLQQMNISQPNMLQGNVDVADTSVSAGLSNGSFNNGTFQLQQGIQLLQQLQNAVSQSTPSVEVQSLVSAGLSNGTVNNGTFQLEQVIQLLQQLQNVVSQSTPSVEVQSLVSAGLSNGSFNNGTFQLEQVIQLLQQLQNVVSQSTPSIEVQSLMSKLETSNFPGLLKEKLEEKVSSTATMQSTSLSGSSTQTTEITKVIAPVHNEKPSTASHMMLAKAGYFPTIVNGQTNDATVQPTVESSSDSTAENMPPMPVISLEKGQTLALFPKSETPKISADQFAQEMSRFLLKDMKISSLNGISHAKISLFPEHLGQLEVSITVHNGQIVAQFMADSAKAKELIEGQLAQLRSTLQNQGLQVDKLEVTQNQQSSYSGSFQEQRQQRSPEQFLRKNQNKQQYDDDLVTFSAELQNAAQMKNLVNGSSFNATA